MAQGRSVDVKRLLKALAIKATHKGGGEYWARCPFKGHNERTGSWSIRDKEGHPKHGLHHCFGCGREGGPIDLVMLRMDVSYGFARDWIEERGLWNEKPFSFEVELVRRHAPTDVFELPEGVTALGKLTQWSPPAREFAINERGLTIDQVARWGAGYAPTGTLAGRIVFPTRDDQGRLRNFSARSYRGHRIKYLSGKRDEGADPGVVFGSYHWPDDRDTVFVSEGVLNALANERAGARAVAALDGSELLSEHLLALGTFKRIIVVTDNDKAGDKAWKKFQGLARWKPIERVNLPKGSDSNDLEQEDPDHLRSLLGLCPKE